MKLVDCSDKTGSEISQMITETYEGHDIPLADCRAQVYDNGANLSGKYNGAQTIMKELFPTAILFTLWYIRYEMVRSS